MSESDNTKELDNYGVWVKKPPRTVSSDETSQDDISPESTENKNAAGDNAMEDIDIDSFLDGAGFSDGSTDANEKKPEETVSSPASSDGTEEVSLDEFLDGGVFEGDDGGSAASEKSEQESKASSSPAPAESENVSLDDFGVSDDITVSDSEPTASPDADDSTLDIDLSFDDAPSSSSSQDSSEPQFETIDSFDSPSSPASESSGITSSSANPDGTESVDLSDFGFDINAPEGGSDSSSDEKAEESSSSANSTNADGTENVDLSDFGFDINAPENPEEEKAPEAPAAEEPKAEAETQPEEHKVDENGMEEISLDDFGFDINAPEGGNESKSEEPAQKTEEAEAKPEEPAQDTSEISQVDDVTLDTSAPSPVDDADLDSLSLDTSSSAAPSPELPESDGIEMNVKADDDMEVEAPEKDENEPNQDFKADDDDFDLDSIMDSIEDENGEKTSLNTKDDVVKDIDDVKIEEPKPEPEPEKIDDLNLNAAPANEIPDSFDEETASLFADEPKETEDDKTESETDTEKTLAEPETADVVEQSEPVFEETSVDLSELPDEISELPDDEPKTDEPQTQNAEENKDSNNIEDSSNPFTLPPDDAFAPAKEEQKAEPKPAASSDDKIAAATEGKDEEIASSTNAILSQIVSELASLKSEISGLKNEFDEIKAKEPAETASENQAEETKTETPAEDNTGFFSGNEDDDTIALSVDELDNILNNAEMVSEDENKSENPESNEDSSEPESNELEDNALEETISDSDGSRDDFLPDYTDDDGEKEDDIFVPKAEEISEAQSPIDFGNVDESEENNLTSENESESSSTSEADDNLSIGDFSFDDGSEKSEPEAQDEIQPEETLSDEMVKSIESSNSITSENPNEAEPSPESSEETFEEPEIAETDDFKEPEVNETDNLSQPEETVDEPFDFGSDTESEQSDSQQDENDFVEPVVTEEHEEPNADNVAISNEELDNLLAPDASINDSLTDENLNYLASDKEIANTEETEDPASSIPGNLKKEIKSVLSYMDQLLENLPEDKIAEFAQSEQFETYKKLFKELGLDKQ